jgi:glycosyltransferase involved in cell wall biosynthesis
VLIVSPCYLPARRFGGPIESIHVLAKALIDRGLEVEVFTTNSNGPEVLDVPIGIAQEVESVPVTYFPVRRPRRFFRSPALRDALRARAAAFDLVYAPWLYAYTTAVAARESRARGVPYVLSPRGMLDRDAILRRSAIRKLLYIALVAGPALRGAAATHFTSENERLASLVRIDASRSIVVGNPVRFPARDGAADLDLARIGVSDGPFVLFLGRLSHIKGLDLLCCAWPQVLERFSEARLVLAGPDDEGLYPVIRRRLEARGAGHAAVHVGPVDGATKEALLRRCRFLVAPSYLESFGMSIVEAMAAGKMVVVTDRVNISPDIAAAGAGLVVPCDTARLADAIVEAWSDPARADGMGQKGKQLVQERWEPDSVARRMAESLGAIVQRASSERFRP